MYQEAMKNMWYLEWFDENGKLHREWAFTPERLNQLREGKMQIDVFNVCINEYFTRTPK